MNKNIFLKFTMIIVIFYTISIQLKCDDSSQTKYVWRNRVKTAMDFDSLIKKSDLIAFAFLQKIETFTDSLEVTLIPSKTIFGDSSVERIQLKFYFPFNHDFSNFYSNYLIFLRQEISSYSLMTDFGSILNLITVNQEDINFEYNNKTGEKLLDLFSNINHPGTISGILEDPFIYRNVYNDTIQYYLPKHFHFQLNCRTLYRRIDFTYTNILAVPEVWLLDYINQKLKDYKRIR